MARGGAGRGQGRKPIGDRAGVNMRTRIDPRHAARIDEKAEKLGISTKELHRRILEGWAVWNTWTELGP